MNSVEHYREAERALHHAAHADLESGLAQWHLEAARIHAMLAGVAVTAVAQLGVMTLDERAQWKQLFEESRVPAVGE